MPRRENGEAFFWGLTKGIAFAFLELQLSFFGPLEGPVETNDATVLTREPTDRIY
jgi:hypothetical protein